MRGSSRTAVANDAKTISAEEILKAGLLELPSGDITMLFRSLSENREIE